MSDCSIQTRAPSHPGSVVAALNEIDFSTDIVGNSPELSLRLKVGSLWLLAIDNLESVVAFKVNSRHRPVHASDFWSVGVLIRSKFCVSRLSELSEIWLCATTRDERSRYPGQT